MTEAPDNDTEVIRSGKVADFEKFLATYDATYTFPKGETFILMEQQPMHLVSRKEQQDLLLFEFYAKESTEESSEKVEASARKAVNYTTGRIFSKDFELRWERRSTDVWIVYIGSKKYAPVLADEQVIPIQYERRFRSYYLFGKPLDTKQIERIGPPAQTGDFAEVRIPRLLRYPPVEGTGKMVKLEVCEYVDTQTDIAMLFRFAGRRKVQI